MIEKVKKRRITMKLLSVILAIVVWLVLTYTVNPTITQQIKNVPVTFVGEDKLADRGLVLINKNDIDTVDIKVRGARSSVINALSLASAKMDVSDVTAMGTKTENVSFDLGVSGVSIIGRSNAVLTIQVDELVEKSVPVRIESAEKAKAAVIKSTPATDNVILRGAKSELEKLSEIVVPVDISGIEEDMTADYDYFFVDRDGVKQTAESLVNPPDIISVTNTVYNKATLNLEFELEDSDHYVAEVQSLSAEKIDVGIAPGTETPEKLSVKFDPKEYRPSQSEYTLEVTAPDNVYIPNDNRRVTVKLNLKSKVRTDLQLDVSVRNVPEGYHATLAHETVNLEVSGIVGDISADKVKAYIDVSGLGEGYHELEVKIETDDNITLEETAHLGVTLSKQKG